MSEATKYLVDCNRLVKGRRQSSECDVYVVLASDYDTLRTANQRLEGEVARLREALLNIAENSEDAGAVDHARAALAGDGGDV